MKNFEQRGDHLTVNAPYAVVSGDGFLLGAMFMVASDAAASGAPVVGVRVGGHSLKKATGEAWTQCQKIYWDNTNRRCTTTASGNTLIGGATKAQASGDTAGSVILTGQIA